MQKIMYLFTFLAFMAASNLSAQSNNCNEICPPSCCILDCKPSQCTPAQITACQAKVAKATAIKSNTATNIPKAIQANFVLEQKEAKPATACCSLFGNNKPASCKKSDAKATKVAYQAEKMTKTACCSLPCCPVKPAASKKMACGSSMK